MMVETADERYERVEKELLERFILVNKRLDEQFSFFNDRIDNLRKALDEKSAETNSKVESVQEQQQLTNSKVDDINEKLKDTNSALHVLLERVEELHKPKEETLINGKQLFDLDSDIDMEDNDTI